MPRNSPEAPTTADDLAACRALLRDGSKSFFAASLLLPRRIRAPASALYAFCRLADDAIDLSEDPRQALAAIRFRLDRAYAGEPVNAPVDRAFAEVVRRYQIPKAVPLCLFEGFAWDVDRRSYPTFADLEAYAVRVAGTVGLMMAMLMGHRDAAALARACDLGVAMQLTNIARDVGEDARAGRLYLPLDWLREAGIEPARFLAMPRHSPALAGVVARLLDVARSHYARAASGIEQLPRDCRPAIRAASLIYAAIGRNLGRGGHDAVTRRTYVGKPQKLALLGQAMLPLGTAGSHRFAEPVASACELIALCAEGQPETKGEEAGRTAGLVGRFVWVVDLFQQLERRSPAGGTGAASQASSR